MPLDQATSEPNTAKCHVVIGHTHLQQDSWSEDGMHRCISLGCMRDPKKTAYMRRHATNFPKWNQGFGVWLDGKYTSLSKRGTVGSGVPAVSPGPSPVRIATAAPAHAGSQPPERPNIVESSTLHLLTHL